MELDRNTHGVTIHGCQLAPPRDHQGYSPVLDGRILGRYRHYDVAASKAHGGAVVMRWVDAVKHEQPTEENE